LQFGNLKAIAQSDGISGPAILKLHNFQIAKLQNFSRLVLPYYEIDPPVDNPRYLP
jgi:hypothetical protein